MKKKKTGRNDPCLCGSGKKYKKCCIDEPSEIPIQPMPKDIQLKLEGQKALKDQRKKQQGLGNKIISLEHKGYRFIAVGENLYSSKNWKTFHDFLLNYLPNIVGIEWCEEEDEKSSQEKHPIIRWANDSEKQISNRSPNQFNSMRMTGPIERYLSLSYALYLLAHNVKLQKRFIKRLKNHKIDQFSGTYTEALIFSAFILSGFKIEIEDEENSKQTHGDFIATFEKTGEKYWVEVKCKALEGKNPGIGTPLYKALSKNTDLKRIVCINTNIDDNIDLQKWATNISAEIRNKEEKLTIKGKPPDSAYILVINAPISNSNKYSLCAFFDSFKIKNLEFNNQLPFRKSFEVREKHKTFFHLFECIKSFSEIPSTFDGTLPELTFSQTKQRYIVGKKVFIKCPDGSTKKGTLKMATVSSDTREIICVMNLEDGKNIIITSNLSNDEFEAYKNNPDNFIAQSQRQTPLEENDYIELCKFFLNRYQQTPKQKLIELLGKVDHLNELTHDELARELSIRFTENVIRLNQKKN